MTAAYDQDTTGLTGGVLTRARRRADAAYAQFHLDVADLIRVVHDSPHPDLDALEKRGVTSTGRGADR